MINCDRCFRECRRLNNSRTEKIWICDGCAYIEEEELGEPEQEPGYSDRFDGTVQVNLEEMIAAEINGAQEDLPESEEAGENYLLGDEDLQQLGRNILRRIVGELRPDLLEAAIVSGGSNQLKEETAAR